MSYLGLALFAEGPTDHRFLKPLLQRVCEEMCVTRGRAPVDVGPVHELHSSAEVRGADRATRILAAARQATGAWNILFIHTDGGGNAAAARAERIRPAAAKIAQELKATIHRTVAVIPVREVEAWTLVDGEALRRALGTVHTDEELGIPVRPMEVEGIADPKQKLEQIHRIARQGRKSRRRAPASAILDLLGEYVGLDKLRQAPAFQEMANDLVNALKELKCLE